MTEDLKNILSHGGKDIDQETLLKYLSGHLSKEAEHDVENNLLGDPFESDAVEGLQSVEDKARLELIVDSLNRDLRKKTALKKAFVEKRALKPQWWLYFSILILLIILALLYIYLFRNLQGG